MQTAALIVAAGMSSRMGDFKPMLSIGSITIAQRVVATFHQAGIQKIVMVTGFHAVTLERHLSGSSEQGLKGAVERCGAVMREICVDDPGTLHDADTPADYSPLVDETKSVRAAGQRMQLSYSSCRNMIRTLESQLNCTLVERTQGGAGGSQSHLTQRAHTLLRRFAAYEQRVREDAEALYEAYFGGVFE